jgi:Ulp1 family protease
MEKKKAPLDTTGFAKVNVKDIPKQMNGSDCGMFACKFAEYLSRNAAITFTQVITFTFAITFTPQTARVARFMLAPSTITGKIYQMAII